MTALVVAEHDNAALKPATLNALAAASEIAGGDVDVLVAGKDCRAVAEAARARSPASRKVLLADDAAYEHGLAENLAPLLVKLAEQLQPSAGAGDDRRQEPDAARRGAARRDADLRHQRRRLARHVRAADLCRQRARDGAVERPDQGHHRARHRLSAAARRPAASAPIETVAPTGAAGLSRIRRRRAVEIRAARADQRPDHHLRRARHAVGREFPAAREGRRQARRRGRRLARRGRCRLCAQRLPGRPDRQDRRARALYRGRHLRRDPASRRHEGLRRSSSPSTRTRRRRSSRSPITAWSAICSRSCPSSPPSSSAAK